MRYILPHVGGESLSHKICLRLMQELKSGIFAQADHLPSENELAAYYGVSRSVIRDALSDLEREGLLQRIRGIGTIINRNIVNLSARLDLKLEYNELIRNMGYVPQVDNVSLHTEPADQWLANRLLLDDGEEVLVCEKRMLAGNRPVIYSIDRLPVRLFTDSGVAYMGLDWQQPVFELLEAHLGFSVDTDIATISATLGPPAIRQKLELTDQDALLFIDEVGYYRLSHPIFHSYGFYTSFFEFNMLRKRY